jgi:hypothetical protein
MTIVVLVLTNLQIYAQKIEFFEYGIKVNSQAIRIEKDIISTLGQPDSIKTLSDNIEKYYYNTLGLDFGFKKNQGVVSSVSIIFTEFSGDFFLGKIRFKSDMHMYRLLQCEELNFDPIEIMDLPINGGFYIQSITAKYFKSKICFIYSGSPMSPYMLTYDLL